MLLVLMSHPFFPSFFYFCEYFWQGGRAQAQTQSLIDESVCLAAGILATNPLAHTHTHFKESWNMCLLI